MAKKYSKKREAILACLRLTKSHPSAEWIYEQLKPEFPDLSLGTVYRNLALFKKEGTVISVGTVEGQERYDAATWNHSHFFCSSCGSVRDVDMLSLPENILAEVAHSSDLKVEGYRLDFYGLCSECSNHRYKQA